MVILVSKVLKEEGSVIQKLKQWVKLKPRVNDNPSLVSGALVFYAVAGRTRSIHACDNSALNNRAWLIYLSFVSQVLHGYYYNRFYYELFCNEF